MQKISEKTRQSKSTKLIQSVEHLINSTKATASPLKGKTIFPEFNRY